MSWKGKTRGGLLGYRIFVWTLRMGGLSLAYFVLYFVALYYFLFAFRSFGFTWFYFRKVQGFSPWASLRGIYLNYYRFGQVLLDKVAIMSGMEDGFTHDFDGRHHLVDLVMEEKPVILISAHIGNWEVASHLLNLYKGKVHVLMHDAEHRRIKHFLDSVMQDKGVHVIPVGEGMTHIFKINEALQSGGMVAMQGDRYLQGQRTLTSKLMGYPAVFPEGPFLLAAKSHVPVVFVFAFKTGRRHYSFYARPAPADARDPMGVLRAYTQVLEQLMKKYPHQWFNFYSFWDIPSDTEPGAAATQTNLWEAYE